MRLSLKSILKRVGANYVRNDSGMPAIEFAFVAPVFFLLLFVIIETGFIFFAEYTLQASVQEASRFVRTGQAQAGGFDLATFKTKVCKTMGIIVPNCTSNITVSVVSATNFANLKPLIPTLANSGPQANGTASTPLYSCGTPEQPAAVIATYDWKIIMKFAMGFMANFDGENKRRLTGMALFQNEPFPASGSCVAP